MKKVVVKKWSILFKKALTQKKLLLNRLPTRWDLGRRGVPLDVIVCPLCNTTLEQADHLFFGCGLALDLWEKLRRWCQIQIPILHNLGETLDWIDLQPVTHRNATSMNRGGSIVVHEVAKVTAKFHSATPGKKSCHSVKIKLMLYVSVPRLKVTKLWKRQNDKLAKSYNLLGMDESKMEQTNEPSMVSKFLLHLLHEGLPSRAMIHLSILEVVGTPPLTPEVDGNCYDAVVPSLRYSGKMVERESYRSQKSEVQLCNETEALNPLQWPPGSSSVPGQLYREVEL
ncbi:hypothetical protein LXL04_018460 [Taraxacum kok-saghyz]